MTDPKMATDPTRSLEVLGNYMQELAAGAAAQGQLPGVGDLLGQRIDRLRLWQDDKNGRFKVKEVALPKYGQGSMERRVRVKSGPKRALDKDLVALLEQISDPEIAVDLTLDMDSGAVSLGVEVEPAIVGQDLASLVSFKENAALPEFEDEDFNDEFWSADQAAQELDVAKSTITRRIKSNELIGFKLFKNALHVPKEQFDGRLVMKGIPEVLAFFEEDHYAAWTFLTSAVFYGAMHPRPIDKIKAAKPSELTACLAEIKRAKEGFDYGDHG